MLMTAVMIFGTAASGCGQTNDEPPESSSQETTSSAAMTEEEDEMYDNSAVVAAYKSKDPSGLTDYDMAIYNAASTAIGEFYSEWMSELEAVLAAHDYIVTHVTYDTEELSLLGGHAEDSVSPYGALIDGKAICSGYTTSFQLFMDMLGIESMIVSGEALDEEHAWNMVCIDEKWYHVDCTWDDYVPDYDGRPPMHLYFLVTDSLMKIQHIWDDSSTPTADSEDLNYYTNNDLYAQNAAEAEKIIENALLAGSTEAEIAMPKDLNISSIALPYSQNVDNYSYWLNSFDTYNVVIFHIRYA